MTDSPVRRPCREHSVPWFWPLAAAIEMEETGLKLVQDNMKYLVEAGRIEAPPPPAWVTDNRSVLELDTMVLRDFSRSSPPASAIPTLIDAPYAGHSATIADHAEGQSLVATLLEAGLKRVLVADWKSATPQMRDYDIDKYLAEINVAVDDLGGLVNLVGLCQGGWMSAMYASRFPRKVATLVLAGAPIDTDEGSGAIKRIAHELPMSFYEDMVAAGGGRMLGQSMLAGWKSMHPGEQYFGKFIDLYEHIEDRSYIERTERFERWYENPIDLPGRYYLQAIRLLFKENRLAQGTFVGLGQRLSLRKISSPVFLLAGQEDDITPQEQVFAAESLVGTAPSGVQKALVPGGHIGLFMGRRTLAETWPGIATWIIANASRQGQP
ncbi:MAG: alpha/beta fold hydrolase [Hyphomicrobiaceae bacterium]|nr:alpha/beta fold hydrolase [Hyphomicrobiaceae bacterium]